MSRGGPDARLGEALAEADRLAREGEERERLRGFPVSCRRGCAACCRYLVRVSAPEADHLRGVVRRLAPGRREEVERRFEAVRNVLEEAGLRAELETGLERQPDDPGFDHRVETLARRYLALAVSCPFLDRDEVLCSIYPDRPAACRQHLVTSDAILCADPFRLNVRTVPMRRMVRDDLVRRHAAVSRGPHRLIALVLI